MKTSRALVVGGGVAGLSAAFELSRHLNVTLLEAETLGAGASGVPVALLNPYRGRTARASDLDLSGLGAMRGLERELRTLGHDPGIRWSGVIRLATSLKQARQWQMRQWQTREREQAGATWLEPETVPVGYQAPFGGLLVEAGGWLEPAKLLAALGGAAQAQGADLRTGVRMRGLFRRGGLWTAATDEEALEADLVVLCLGAGEIPGVPLRRLERLAGDVLTLTPAPALPYPLAGALYGVQLGPRFLLGGNHRAPEAADPEAATRLQRSGGYFIPALREARLEAHWTGVRARREDNQPLLAELEPGLWFLGALGGRGFLVAALLAASLRQRLGLQAS